LIFVLIFGEIPTQAKIGLEWGTRVGLPLGFNLNWGITSVTLKHLSFYLARDEAD
jgi:hypothetical protein